MRPSTISIVDFTILKNLGESSTLFIIAGEATGRATRLPGVHSICTSKIPDPITRCRSRRSAQGMPTTGAP